jgi:putative FmdB family regulatory protein
MPLYDYVCKPCDTIFEAFNSMDNRDTAPCPKCGEECSMKLTAPRVALDPISGDFPGATMAWERKRKEKMKQEVKQDKGNL